MIAMIPDSTLTAAADGLAKPGHDPETTATRAPSSLAKMLLPAIIVAFEVVGTACGSVTCTVWGTPQLHATPFSAGCRRAVSNCLEM
jgi:hypothetical protein